MASSELESAANSKQRKRMVRIGAMADIHCSKGSEGHLQPMFMQVAKDVDV